MRHAYYAGRSGNWDSNKEEFQKDGRLSAWASFQVRECSEKVESEEKGRLIIAKDILSRPSVEWEVSPCRTCALIVIASRRRTTFGGFLQGSSVICGVRRMTASTIGGLRTGSLSYKTVWIFEKRKYFEHTLDRKECAITSLTR